ncbi:MAG: PDZ domain-containing protein [Thermoplasmata archaeon]|nr:PDZ domain-containing protein [Thermoplasmata archaeon]
MVITYDAYGLNQWDVISKINGIEFDNFTVWEKLDAGKMYNVTIWRNGKEMNASIIKGLYVWDVEENSPADGVLPEKSIIYAINDAKIESLEEFTKLMNSTHAGEKINISFYCNGNFSTVSLILGDKYDFIKNEEYKGKGFIGVNVIDLQNVAIHTKDFIKIYNPRKTNLLLYLALPFRGYSPPPSGVAEILTASPSFWMAYNIFYWIFWLNFAVGTFNALPAIPLDGGYLFKDGISYFLEKLSRKMKKERLEKVSSLIATIFSVFVLICIFSIILIPKLRLLISF